MITLFKKIDRYFVINFLLTALFLSSTFYLLVGVKSFGDNPLKDLPLYVIIVLFGASLVFFGSLIAFNFVVKRYRPMIALSILTIVLFALGIISICKFPNVIDFIINKKGVTSTINYSITNSNKFIYICQLFGMLALTFSIIDIFPKIFEDIDWTYALAFLGIIFTFVSVIYSLIFEFDFYSTFINKLMNKETDFNCLHSFYPNKNSYCVILFIGMVASLFLHQRKFKWWWLVIAFFFLINIIITFCKAFTFVSPLFFLAYLLYRFILSVKSHPIRNIIVLSITIILLVGLISAIFIMNNFVEGFNDYFVKIFILGTSSSLESRFIIWNIELQMLTQTDFLLGMGYHNFGSALNTVLSYETSFQFAHNAIFEIIGNGGLILLLGAIAIFAYLIYLLIKEFKKHKSLVLFESLLIIFMMPVMFVESGSIIFPFTMDYAFFSALIFIPIIKYKKEIKLPKILN